MYPQDIRPLTSLRFAAALWVLVYHFRDHLGLQFDRYGLVAEGYLGVDLFFILSGFILTHVYLKQYQQGRFRYGSFLWARLARIYPVHLATLAATIGLWWIAIRTGAAFDPVAFDPKVLPWHLLLMHAWGTTPTVQWNFPSWSISAEWFAYVGFPLVAMFALAWRRFPAAGVAAALALFAILLLFLQSHGLKLTEMTAQIGAVRIIPAFVLGAMIYRLGNSVSLPPAVAWTGLSFVLAYIALTTTLGWSDLFIWPALGLLIFLLGETAKGSPNNLLGAAPLVYLGEVSYALYMTHLPVDIAYFHGLQRLAPRLAGPRVWVAWGGVFVVAVLVAVVTHHLIERPARNWMRAHDPWPKPDPSDKTVDPVI
jgi:peptidoglycan/LPS O-acetylase OafA/YrhL